MQKITTFLWYNNQAQEAANYYIEVFQNGRIVSRMGSGENVMGVTFELFGQEYIGLNGGPNYTFTPAISLFVNCEDQAEVDRYWDRIIADGGRPDRCGWLQDKYGLSWQIIPKQLGEMLGASDSEAAGRAMQAMLTMSKIDVAVMKAAFDGESVAA